MASAGKCPRKKVFLNIHLHPVVSLIPLQISTRFR